MHDPNERHLSENAMQCSSEEEEEYRKQTEAHDLQQQFPRYRR
jgi:hypothetical protein